MGCDIHLIVEARENENLTWYAHVINPYVGRPYELFSILAGVRGWHEESMTPRGLPGDVSGDTKQLYDKGEDGEGFNYFHSASHVNLDEFEYCLNVASEKMHQGLIDEYEEMGRRKKPPKEEYFKLERALLNYLRSTQDKGIELRIVFWFDS
jgi:hypothetical protein